MRYAAIELMPTTTSGNASFWFLLTSMSQEKDARNAKQTPPLQSVHDGVQMRLTIGQIPVKCSNRPAAISATAAIANLRRGILGAASWNQRPAITPSNMVPSVGIKLRVK